MSERISQCRECGAASHGHRFCNACHQRWLEQQQTSRGTCLGCGRDCGPTMKRCQRCHDRLKQRRAGEESAALSQRRRDAESAAAERRAAPNPVDPPARYAVACSCGCGAEVRVHTSRPGRYYAPGHQPQTKTPKEHR